MAEALLRNLSDGEFEVKSAGLFADRNSRISPNAQKALENTGISFHHISQPVTESLLTEADQVITMTRAHQQQILAVYPHFHDKTKTLTECVGEEGDIADPFGGNLLEYEKTASELKRLIDKFYKQYRNQVE
jgi:protein-tyrosine phosphatase